MLWSHLFLQARRGTAVSYIRYFGEEPVG
jgi:hypothetical protein